MVRQFFMDNFNFNFYAALCQSKDSFLFSFANKSLKEVTYHFKRSSEWMIRLGDGTEEAHQKTQLAINELYPFTHELFNMNDSRLHIA
jgi:ring-1,2-phenylacetyl-CoA epoxidase subunit PaaC